MLLPIFLTQWWTLKLRTCKKHAFIEIEFFSDYISLKLLILKNSDQNFACNIKKNWAIEFFPMITGQNQNLAMISYKMLGNMDKKISSQLADFGR